MLKCEIAGIYEIETVDDRWYDPNVEYMKVRTQDGKRYILRYDERADKWTLQGGFDGPELLARPNIERITVDPGAIRTAESMIAGCEHCRGEAADHLFDAILADVLGKHGPCVSRDDCPYRTSRSQCSGFPIR